jgi:hypothetical protein
MDFEQPLVPEHKKLEEIEKSIILLKRDGVPDSNISEGLENPLSGRKGASKLEIEQAFQNLRNYGFIGKDGLITEEGIDSIE